MNTFELLAYVGLFIAVISFIGEKFVCIVSELVKEES